MLKGYWLAINEIHDQEMFKAYQKANRAALRRFGARFIIAHGRHKMVEGEFPPVQTLVEFPSYEMALAAYDDPEYQRASQLRLASSNGKVVIVEGFAEPPDFWAEADAKLALTGQQAAPVSPGDADET